jgi:hypothetical protein
MDRAVAAGMDTVRHSTHYPRLHRGPALKPSLAQSKRSKWFQPRERLGQPGGSCRGSLGLGGLRLGGRGLPQSGRSWSGSMLARS